ncbi:hypothetical protein [Mesorhizobium sp.]|uniref:hypothetical protein n=1 Tax=Mesorhizobium sp. TaxID=1871066 RepID=UPI0025C09C9B|nr:hypothetical protein [Mesorhizobium sp.]
MALGLDRALGGDQRLRDGLAAEDALPVELGAATTVQIVFELLEVENVMFRAPAAKDVMAVSDRKGGQSRPGAPEPRKELANG